MTPHVPQTDPSKVGSVVQFHWKGRIEEGTIIELDRSYPRSAYAVLCKPAKDPDFPEGFNTIVTAGQVVGAEAVKTQEEEPPMSEETTEEIIFPLVASDTETDLIGAGNITPNMVCQTFYDLQSQENTIFHYMDPSLSEINQVLFDTHRVIFHNACFDLDVLLKHSPGLLDTIWKALEEGRVHDTLIREKLLNLALSGGIDDIEYHGVPKKGFYGQADLEKIYLNIDRTQDKEAEDSARVTYHLVAHKPLEKWPEQYRSYALEDPKNCGEIFLRQEAKRFQIMDERGYDPFKVESFTVMKSFVLRLMAGEGLALDEEKVREMTDHYKSAYQEPKRKGKLIKAGLIIPAVPAKAYANGSKEHLPTCPGHKENMLYKKGKKIVCECPPKMKGAELEKGSDKNLHNLIWTSAKANPSMEVKITDKFRQTLKDANAFVEVDGETFDMGASTTIPRAVLDHFDEVPSTHLGKKNPTRWSVVTDEKWMDANAHFSEVLEMFAARQKIKKIITSYLPLFYWVPGATSCKVILEGEEDELGGKVPAERIYTSYDPLKETGRTSSRANKKDAKKGKAKALILFPSLNCQQVDPRVRGCMVADGYLEHVAQYGKKFDLDGYKGSLLYSIDFSAMELATCAQTCIDLGFHSVMAEKINAGCDLHAYLGAQIATALDEVFASYVGNDPDKIYQIFSGLEGCDELCESASFVETYYKMNPDDIGQAVTWDSFYKFYRKLAKPVGLGYPGGLGPATMSGISKAQYKLDVSVELASQLREIWRATFPEVKQAHEHLNKRMIDPFSKADMVERDGKMRKRSWYCYDSPLGMHRGKCSFTAAANGFLLQTPSTEGAMTGVIDVVKSCIFGPHAGKVFPTFFIHDELVGNVQWLGAETTEIITAQQRQLEAGMREITKDVAARTEAVLMYRWNKYAEPSDKTWSGGKKGEGYMVPFVEKEKVA